MNDCYLVVESLRTEIDMKKKFSQNYLNITSVMYMSTNGAIFARRNIELGAIYWENIIMINIYSLRIIN